MRLIIYNFLVNRHSGIRSRYHRIHDNAGLTGRILEQGAVLSMWETMRIVIWRWQKRQVLQFYIIPMLIRWH